MIYYAIVIAMSLIEEDPDITDTIDIINAVVAIVNTAAQVSFLIRYSKVCILVYFIIHTNAMHNIVI